MSILIDELEARKNDYILVADVIEAMANATNSKPDDVVKYLNAHDVDEHLTVFYMGENYNFYQYNSFLVNVGNNANTTYFLKSDVIAFEPITKHGIFKDDGNDQLELYQKNLNLKPNSLKITNANNLISKAPPPPNHIKATTPFKQKTIGDVIKAEKQKDSILPNGYQQMTMLYDYFTPHQAACFIAGLHPNFNGCDDGLEMGNSVIDGGLKNGKLVTDDDGQFKADDLKSFLYSKNWIMTGFNDNLPNDTDKIPAPTVKQTEPPNNEQLLKKLTAANAKIADLENQLSQAQAELANKPTDSITQSNTDIHNIKKEAIKQFNRSLATVLIDLDYKGKLRKGDIANYIVPYMKELAFVLADEQQDKANSLTVTYDTLYDNHLKNLGFKQGRQSDDEKQKVNIDLLFKKQLPITK